MLLIIYDLSRAYTHRARGFALEVVAGPHVVFADILDGWAPDLNRCYNVIPRVEKCVENQTLP